MSLTNTHFLSDVDTTALIDICRQHNVTWIGVFGSVARGEAQPHSDIDLLARFGTPRSLIAVITLEQELTAVLGRQVDLLTEAALSPYMRDRVLHDLQVLYEA